MGFPSHSLYGGAFGISDPRGRALHYAQIPADTHILITHSPPYGILETAYTTFVNAALLGPDGDIANRPILFNLPEVEP